MEVVKVDVKKGEVSLPKKELKTKKEVRKIVEEDEFVDELGKIIQRDYFPDIPKLKAQCEYLEAVQANDLAKIRALQERYSVRRTEQREASPTRRSPGPTGLATTSADDSGMPRRKNRRIDTDASNLDDSPTRIGQMREKETIGVNDNDGKRTAAAAKDEATANVTVDSFVNKYTTEDDAAFEELSALNVRRERHRNWWMYESTAEHNISKVVRGNALKGQDEQLMLPESRPNSLDNWPHKERNTVLYFPGDQPWTDEELIRRQKQSQREINAQNTRLKEAPYQQAISRRPTGVHASSLTKVDVTGAVINPGFNQQRGQFSMMVTPSPAPGVNESPLMTWGEIEGTPFLLDAADMPLDSTSAPSFKIPEEPLRDQIAHSLSDTISRRYRDRRKHAALQHASAIHSKTPKFGSVRSTEGKLLAMSPAARRLATAKLGIRVGTDKSLRDSYTPGRTPGRNSTPLSVPGVRTTPARDPEKTFDSSTQSITDNLLNLNPTSATRNIGTQRPKAADYF